jgi:hypothetical protein
MMGQAVLSRPMCRRSLLSLGGLWPFGLTLPRLLAAQPRVRRRAAQRCLLVFMEGGPSHIDLWDVKPQAPLEVRGEFRPIQSSHPELPLSELLPGLSRHAHRFAVIRSVTHGIVDHNAGSYYALCGRFPVEGGQLVLTDRADTFPPLGAVVAKLRPTSGPLPAYVQIAEKQFNNGYDIPGQAGGFLGPAYDPFVTGDPSIPDFTPSGFSPLPELSADRIAQRSRLLADLEQSLARLSDDPRWDRLGVFQRQALQLISSPEVRSAFDLSQEPAALREKYGMDRGSNRAIEARKFGGLPHLGQSTLLARRLLERGVRLVTLVTGRRIDQAWDTHRQHFRLMRQSLCPPFDQAMTALLDDLAERGLLDDTLVVFFGEFGRTPKIGYVTSGAGATSDGRDHWPYCYSVVMAGAGIQPGALYGASDRDGAYPIRDAVRPEDIVATVYAALGIAPHTEIFDREGRPHVVSTGRPIEAVLASS